MVEQDSLRLFDKYGLEKPTMYDEKGAETTDLNQVRRSESPVP
ncbi:MAG: hypothetical protein ACLT1C_09790 [Weissella confusa]